MDTTSACLCLATCGIRFVCTDRMCVPSCTWSLLSINKGEVVDDEGLGVLADTQNTRETWHAKPQSGKCAAPLPCWN